MENIDSTNEKVAIVIDDLLAELLDMGAIIHPSIYIKESSGELSISCQKNIKNTGALLTVPLTCMPLLVDFEFTLKPHYKIASTMKKGALNPNAEQIMNLMVLLYNYTDKLKAWNDSYPLLTLKKHNELLNAIYSFRPQGKKLSAFKKLFDQNKYDELLLHSFIGSREFTYKQEALASANIHTVNQSEKGLLSIIDFLNHQMGDSEYKINRQTGCMEICANAENETGEIFVQYSFMDAVQTYLTYGFVDNNAHILYSGRLQFTLLSGLNFVVLSLSGGLKRTVALPSVYKHLHNYLPAGIKRDGNNVVVSDLVIPKTINISYFSESLAVILTQCDQEGFYKDTDTLAREIEHIERQVLAVNIDFWQKFLVTFEKSQRKNNSFNKTTGSDLRLLVENCCSHCQGYSKVKGYI